MTTKDTIKEYLSSLQRKDGWENHFGAHVQRRSGRAALGVCLIWPLSIGRLYLHTALLLLLAGARTTQVLHPSSRDDG